MALIEIHTLVHAPIERCFDLNRSVDLHIHSSTGTNEEVVGGVMTGLMNLDDTVTWRARHFGITQDLSSRVTEFVRPTYFRTVMIRGAFKRIDHSHEFSETEAGTMMYDRFEFEAPLGVLGRIAEALFLTRYMRAFLIERCRVIKSIAESDEWKRFLNT